MSQNGIFKVPEFDRKIKLPTLTLSNSKKNWNIYEYPRF